MTNTDLTELINRKADYIIHTTSLADVYIRHIVKEFPEVREITVHGDCFYGWGEKPTGPACKLHVQIRTTDPDTATKIDQYLYSRDYEVVTTGSEDEHFSPWSLGIVPCRYSANHTH